MATVSKHLEEMYDDYYMDDGLLLRKRELEAGLAVDKIAKLFGAKLGSVVDVGAGNGNVAQVLSDRGMYDTLHALEISQSGIDAILRRNLPGLVEARSFDGYETGYADKQFDVAMAIHVVEHVEHERLFLQELARISREVYVEIPLEANLRGQVCLDYGHINYYTARYFLNTLETSGLKPISFDVFEPAREVELLIDGRVKGAVKNSVRKGIRKLAGPMLASYFTAYLMGIRCQSI